MEHLSMVFLLSLLLVGTSGQAQPNILFLLVDDLGYNDVGYHDSTIKSPVFTQLASEGIIIENNYVAPLCSPSRAALLTGRYTFHVGYQEGNAEFDAPVCLTQEHPILPEAMKALGYNTYILGKWHMGFCKDECTPTHRGFDKFYGFHNGQGSHYTHENEGYYDFFDDSQPETCVYGQYSGDLYGSRALEYLDSHVSDNSTKDNPFFMYFSFQTVHSPLEVPQEYLQRHLDEPNPDRRVLKAMVSVTDDIIGNLVQKLKEHNLYDNTVIIFSTDNGGPEGYSLNTPLRGSKGTLWEGGVRVPGFVHSPLLKASAGTVTHGLFHITDWFPTIVSLAGGIVPGYIDGYDQTDFLINGGLSKRHVVPIHYTQYDPPKFNGTALRKDKWKLIKATDDLLSLAEGNLTAENNILLFDLEADPSETTNLAPANPGVVKELDEVLQGFATTAVEVDPNWWESSPESNPELRGWVWGPGWC